MYHVYIIECEDESLYTGIAKDVYKRFNVHKRKQKQGAKYTRSHNAMNIKALWETNDRSNALKLEYRIKQLRREQKLLLICDNKSFEHFFAMLPNDAYRRINLEGIKEK